MNTPGKALLFLAAWTTSALAATTVTQSVEPTTLGTDDQAQVLVEVADAKGGARVSLPPSDDYEVLGRTSSTSTSFTDDGTGSPAITRSQRFLFTIQPRRAGAVQVPGATVEVDGQHLTADATQLDVSEGHVASAAPQQRSGDPFASVFGSDPFDDPFFRGGASPGALIDRFFNRGAGPARPFDARLLVSVDKPEVYAGQQATVSVYLATRSPINSVGGLRMPTIDGAASQDLDVARRLEPRPMSLDGKDYQAFLIARRAVFPSKPGALTIPAVTLSVGAGGAFDLPGERTLSSAQRTLEVKALPPGGEAGEPVGQWSASMQVGARVTPTAGQPVPVQVTLEGTGDLQALPEPELSVSGPARVLAPTVKDEPGVKGTAVGGRRVYEFLVTPEAEGPLTISGLRVAYFNPATGRHETASAPALRLDVAPAPGLAARPSAAPATPEVTGAVTQPPPGAAAPSSAERWAALRPALESAALFLAAALVVVLGALLLRRTLGRRVGRSRAQRRAATRALAEARAAARAGHGVAAVRLAEQALTSGGAAVGLDAGREDLDRLAADATQPFVAAWAQALLRCRRARYLVLDPDAVAEVLAKAASGLDELGRDAPRPPHGEPHSSATHAL
ncbi:MAG: hypothetical protein AMXMBFR34_18960 [Myxococcaceae bacterium]